MMGDAQGDTTLEAQLGALQCHFTWDLVPRRPKLLRIKDELEDIGTGEGNSWLGHVYNLLGYVHYRLGSTDEARSFLSRAEKALCRARQADKGPWLAVNYGNRAWLHYHQGELAESRDFLSQIEALASEYPPPSHDEPHPEIYAERAWTLMKFGKDKKLPAVDFFERAIRMQPDVVEWQTSHVLALAGAVKHDDAGTEPEFLEKMKRAKERDPENLYLAAAYLHQLAKGGKRVEDEACELAQKVLRNPVGIYSGIKPLLRVYRSLGLLDEAVDLAEEALEKHPDDRYLKRCAALCYKWKVVLSGDSQPKQSVMNRAIRLYRDLIPLYPDSSFVKRIDLASIYAKSRDGLVKSEDIYQELLEQDLEPAEKQLLFNNYAKHLYFDQQDRNRSIQYHMKAAAIPEQSFFRENSIRALERIRDRGRSRMCGEIEEFLANLQDA